MPKKRSRGKEDPIRRLVQGILTLVLSTLASFLAGKLTDLILGPADEQEEEEAE
jgi:hypothetical protein